MRHRVAPVLLALPLLFSWSACTDVGLYAVGGDGPSSADRAELEGTVCVPLATGDAFPVRVLFAVPGGQGVSRDVVGQVATALDSLNGRFSFPYIRFSLLGYHTVASSFTGTFVPAAELSSAIAQYSAFDQGGPWSLRAPLRLAQSHVAGDMLTGCRGLVGRTRYLVVLVVTDPDTSCANPAFNAGIDSRCSMLMPDEAACGQCELARVTEELSALSERYRAGEVSVQPIYVRTSANPLVSAQVAAIARSGGTQVIETDPASLQATLNGLDYASLQRELVLKRFIAFNRNAVARGGKLLLDSDGDGVPDEDEERLGTDPLAADTDLDGLGDGVELKMGTDPRTPDTVAGCNPFLDTDGDRLNDCEEKVLGTEPCLSDTDGDSLPDLIELLAGTNPLVAEDLDDSDGDGRPDLAEVAAQTDPHGADLAFSDERAHVYAIGSAPPTADGRACYLVSVRNVGLVTPRARPNPPWDDLPEGQNELYLYMQVGRPNDPRGSGVGSLHVEQVVFTPGPPAKRSPAGLIPLRDEAFVVGN